MNDKPKDSPPFAYKIRRSHINVTFCVFSYESLKTDSDIWRYVAQFLGNRKRRMPVNWQNLPHEVKLLVTQDGKVRAFDLPNQHKVKDAQKIQIRVHFTDTQVFGEESKEKVKHLFLSSLYV